MHWSAGFVGLPWQRERPGPGVRCWSLVSRVLGDVKALAVPDYEGPEASASELRELHFIRSGAGQWPWITIVSREESDRVTLALKRGREFDVALFRAKGLHAGILTGRGEMLHIEEGQTSRLEKIASPAWAPRFLALYRHEALA